MPRYYPNSRFNDCWASAGDVTFFHRDGVCYWKKRGEREFQGTATQLSLVDLHKRALAAWRNLDPAAQELWNGYARSVYSHRPPFIKDHSISGYNLFVSAYHGFAQLGREHVPVPRAYEELPVFTCDYDSAAVVATSDLLLRLRVRLEQAATPSRFRLATRLQLTGPGQGRNAGYLRSFLATANCTAPDCVVEVRVPDFKTVWHLDLQSYQVHMRYLLIDSETGYRNIYKRKSFLIEL